MDWRRMANEKKYDTFRPEGNCMKRKKEIKLDKHCTATPQVDLFGKSKYIPCHGV